MKVEYYILSKYTTVRRNLLRHNIKNVQILNDKIDNIFQLYLTPNSSIGQVGRPVNDSEMYKLKVIDISGQVAEVTMGNKKRAREVCSLLKKQLISFTESPILSVVLSDNDRNILHLATLKQKKDAYSYNIAIKSI